jgi:putative YphP/YqiW family bacilliredoxin
MYENILVYPMREEVIRLGFKELKSPRDVKELMNSRESIFIFVNSVCGCAASKARPGLAIAIKWAINNSKLPDKLYTVFAGVDTDAVNELRKHFKDYPPSSPQMGLMKNGELISLIQRDEIENKDADSVAQKIIRVFDKYC